MTIKNMKTGAKGVALIKEFEGYHTKLHNGDCQAYLDKLPRPALFSPGYKGLWTIGWGSTGPGITKGTVWTQKQAEAALLKVIKGHEDLVKKHVTVPLDQNQFDALVSISYNLSGGIASCKTLLRKLNAKDYVGASQSFLLYNKAGGKTVRGLTRRREAEKALFDSPTPKQIVEHSKKLTLFKRLRNAVAGLVSTVLAADWMGMLNQVKDFATSHYTLMFIAGAAALWIILKIVEAMSVKDVEDGRYTPSGLVDDDLSP